MKTDLHTESAFESAIADHLSAHGYLEGSPDDFDQERCLFQDDLFTFIQETQPKVWDSLASLHGDDRVRATHTSPLRTIILDALVKTLVSQGTLDVLRHGFKVYGKKIHMAFFKPAFGLNPEATARYAMNRLTVTRQVEYLKGDPRDPGIGRPDIVISLNGLPIITMELKNQMTGQNVEHARKRYTVSRKRGAFYRAIVLCPLRRETGAHLREP